MNVCCALGGDLGGTQNTESQPLSLSLSCWWLCSFVFLMLLPSPGGYLSAFLIKPLSKMKTLFLGVCNKIAQSLYLILIVNIQIIDFKFVPFAV